MLKDLISDDTLQIETGRLRLRWPRASDAAAITKFASLAEVANMTAMIPHPYPVGAAEAFIMKARSENAEGCGLTLAILQKARAQSFVGVVGARLEATGIAELGYALSPAFWGKGLATEAARAFVGAVFRLTSCVSIRARVRVDNASSRRVLEKIGFAFVDRGFDFLPARGSNFLCDHLELARGRWLSPWKSGEKHLPPMSGQRTAERS